MHTPAPERFESDPGVKEQRPQETDSVEARLVELAKKLDRLTLYGRQERYHIWAQVDLFSKAIHYFSYDPYTGTFEEWDEEDQEVYQPAPLTNFAIEMISAEYGKSKPRLVPAIKSGSRKAQAVADDLQYWGECKQREFWLRNPEERQLENKLVITRGIVYSQLEFDRSQGDETQMPVLEMQGEQLANRGQETYRKGRVVRRIRDPFQVEIYAATIEESPALTFEEVAFRAQIRKRYPHVEIKDYTPPFSHEEGYSGVCWKRELERFVSNSGEIDQSQNRAVTAGERLLDDLTCLHRKVWLDLWLYEDIQVTAAGGLQLPGTNKVLPQGTRLGAVFPEGLVLCFVNDSLVALEHESKEVWDCYRYTVPAEGAHGPALAPVITLNKGYDETQSLRFVAAMMHSLGITLVDERLKSVSNVPGSLHVVEDRRANERLSDMVHHIQTTGPGAEAAALGQDYKENLVDLSGMRSPNTSGLSGPGMKTATGVEYQNATANAASAPKLENYAAHAARVVTKAIKMELKYGVEPVYVSKYGDTHGRWIDLLNVPDGFVFEVEEDSHQPRTTMDVKNDTVAAVNLGWGSGKLAPAADEQIGKVMHMPTGAQGYKDWATKAEKRLDRLKEIAAVVEQVMAVQPQMFADPVMEVIERAEAAPQSWDNHQHMQRFYLEVYVTDEFEKMSPLLQNAVRTLWELHQVAAVGVAGRQMMLEQQALAPIAEEEAAREAAGKEQDAANQERGRQADREGKERAAQSDRDHKERAAQADRDHKERMQREQHAHDERMQRAGNK